MSTKEEIEFWKKVLAEPRPRPRQTLLARIEDCLFWLTAFLLTLLLISVTAPRSANATAGVGVAPPASGGVGCTITGVSHSGATTFKGNPNGDPSGTGLGTFSATTTGSCATPTWTISDTTDFQVSGSALQTNGTPAPGNYTTTYTATIAGATGSPFTSPSPLSITGNGITGVTLSSTSFPSGSATGTVIGAISVAELGGTFAGSLSGSLTSATGDTCANFAACFQIVSSNLETQGTRCSSPPCSYSISLTATQSGIGASPKTVAFTITSGALVNLTAIETTGSTQTNVPVTVGVPLAAGAMATGQHLTATDGISGNPIACGEDNRASDLTPNLRFTTLSCIIPSLTANTTDNIAITVASGAPGTGTDISLSDILATSYDAAISITDTSGNTYTASPRTAFSSGHSSWVNMTTPSVFGKWRSGNGIVTGYISFVPLTHSGTAHSWLYAKFDTECYKGATGAVSGGNPILSCATDVIIGTGNTTVSSFTGADQFYGLSIGPSGSCANWPNGTAGSAVINQNVAYQNASMTVSSSSLADMGKVYADGTGFGIVDNIIDSTHESLGVFTPFAATNLTGATTYGIGHVYGTRIRYKCGWIPSGTAPQVWVEKGNLYLGNPWNNSTLTGGPGTYFKGSWMVLNYSTTPSQVTNTLQSTFQGHNPASWSAFGGIGGTTGGESGYWAQYQQTTGDRSEIAVDPSIYADALIRWDSNAAAMIFENADKANQYPAILISPTTGKTLPPNDGNDYSYDSRWGNYTLNVEPGQTNGYIQNWGAFPQNGHQGDWYYVPYILTGDWYWLNDEENLMLNQWASVPNNFAGNQLNRSAQGGPSDLNPRGMAWNWRTLGHLGVIIPDSNTNAHPSPVLSWTKDTTQTLLENQYIAVNSNNWQVYPTPGSNIDLAIPSCTTYPGATCNTHFRAQPAPRYVTDTGGCLMGGFQASYMLFAAGSLYELGMLSANGLNYYTWLAESFVSMETDPTEIQPLYAALAYYMEQMTGGSCTNVAPSGSAIYDWATAWHTISLSPEGPPSSFWCCTRRQITGTATLSATSGLVTVTIPAGGYMAGTWNGGGYGSFYVGGWMTTPSDSGACQITAVTSPTTFSCDTNGTRGHVFGSTSYTNTTFNAANPDNVWNVAMPAPGDPGGMEYNGIISTATSPGLPYYYLSLSQGAMIMINRYLSGRISNTAGALSTILSWSGGTQTPSPGIGQWNMTARP